MKKTILLFILFFSITFYGYSQIEWNIKAGINMSKITDWDNVDFKPGYQFGAGLSYYFTEHWGIQPSLILISKGYKSKGNYTYPTETELSTFNRKENRVYLEVPVMLAYRFSLTKKLQLVLNGGGFASYGVGGHFSNKVTSKNGSKDKYSQRTFSNDAVERFDVGLGTGTTLEISHRYLIGLIGEWGLKNALPNSKNQTYGLNIGYKF